MGHGNSIIEIILDHTLLLWTWRFHHLRVILDQTRVSIKFKQGYCCIRTSVQATEDWIQAQIPGIVKEALVVSPKEDGSPEMPLNADADMEALAQAHVNILAGACLSIGALKLLNCMDRNQKLF